jgi:mannose-6-phosphate isomerase-like protein (cupin superfamily)
MPYVLNIHPFVVPTTDGKLIEEHVGLASSGDSSYSLAHMVAPPGWSEPYQQPAFDEFTIVVKGRKCIEVDGEVIALVGGQSILIRSGSRVRYSNPYPEAVEYWSICVPAFSLQSVNRDAVEANG